MAQEVVISGRIVQGEIKLRPKTDQQNRPVMDKQTPPQQVIECYIGLAVAKGSQDWNTVYAAMYAEARGFWPQYFDAQGQMTMRDFAWKFIDGDNDRDSENKPYSLREGFAGHYVLKLATRYLPKCYPAMDKLGAAFEIATPSEVIKPGDYVGVILQVAPNEVQPGGQAKCGLYLSPNKIVFLAQGKRIETGGGMSAEEGFANRQFALPPGVVQGAAPTMGGQAPVPPQAHQAPPMPQAHQAPPMPQAHQAPPMPQAHQAPPMPQAHQAPPMPQAHQAPPMPQAHQAPPMPQAGPALPAPGNAMPPPPPVPQQAPRSVVIAAQYAAQGVTVDGLRQQGFDDNTIVANGWGTWQ